jgi:hypothetical protein
MCTQNCGTREFHRMRKSASRVNLYITYFINTSDIPLIPELCSENLSSLLHFFIIFFHYLYFSFRRLYICMALQPFVGPWSLFSFLIFYTVGKTPSTGDQLVARPLPTQRTAHTQNWNPRSQCSNERRQFMT